MSYLIKWIQDRIFNKNKNFLCIVVGETGSGKSTVAMALAEKLDPNFTINNLVFKVDDFMNLLTSGKLKRGSVVIWDEAGVGMPSREWWTISNKAINYVLQTFRHLNLIVFFTTPDFSFIDSQSRKLFHAYMETSKIDYKNKVNIMKCFLIQNNPKTGKIYFKYPKVSTNQGVITLDPIKVNLPSEALLQKYEEKKLEFTSWLNESMGARIKSLEFKTNKGRSLTCRMCGYRWRQKADRQPVKCPQCDSRRWNKAI